MKRNKIIAYICTIAMLLSIAQPVYAITGTKYVVPTETEEDTITIPVSSKYVIEDSTESESDEEVSDTTAPYALPVEFELITDSSKVSLTVDEAVAYGLEYSTVIKTFENMVDHAIVTVSIYEELYDEFDENYGDLNDAEDAIEDAELELEEAQEELDDVVSDFEDDDLSPSTIKDDYGNTIVKSGNEIASSVYDYYYNTLLAYFGGSESIAGAYGYSYATIVAQVYDGIRAALDDYQEEIDENSLALAEAQATFDLSEYMFDDAISSASDELDDIFGYNSVVAYDDVDDLGNLMVTVANVNLDVSRYAKGIYRNQIAMLIKSNYYDALYAQKAMALKAVAMERGEAQYDAVKLSYENGMKSKDDYLLAKMYYDGTKIAYTLAESTYNNALYELKENINMDMATELVLTDSMIDEVTSEDLEEGLKSGMTNRVEIQQALGNLKLQELNQEILLTMYTKQSDARSDELVEAEILVEEAEIALEQAKQTVSSEIYQSYELMVAAGDMLEESKELVVNAEEVLEIAQLKYDQGFGADNSLLTSLNLESSSGTIIELLAAEENLADMEAQVAKIYYSYTMAKIKYYNDAGILVYK